MRLNEIVETIDLRVSTLVKMVQTLIRKKVSVRIETRYETGEIITGNVHSMTLKPDQPKAPVELTYDMAMPGGWSNPQWTRVKTSEAERMELKKQSDGSYLLTVPNEDWEKFSVKTRLMQHAKRVARNTLGLGGAKDRHSGD